jgi:hypothetical protein
MGPLGLVEEAAKLSMAEAEAAVVVQVELVELLLLLLQHPRPI